MYIHNVLQKCTQRQEGQKSRRQKGKKAIKTARRQEGRETRRQEKKDMTTTQAHKKRQEKTRKEKTRIHTESDCASLRAKANAKS